MGGQQISLVHIFGPWVQIFFNCGLLLMTGWVIAAVSFWGERRLIQTGKRVLWLPPLPALFAGLLYGVLRFSGWLVYPADGWDASGMWNCTNQNSGAVLIFLCGCMLTGAALAARRVLRERLDPDAK